MQSVKLSASRRERLGKGGARETRRQGLVPVVVYGKEQETGHYSVEAHDLKMALVHHARILELECEGVDKMTGLIREVQRHPVTDEVVHMDLLAVTPEDMVRTKLPILLEGAPIGVKEGGQVRRLLHRVTVESKVDDLSNFFVVDITDLHAGRNLLVKDLKSDTMRVTNPEHVAVVQITKPRIEEEVVEAE